GPECLQRRTWIYRLQPAEVQGFPLITRDQRRDYILIPDTPRCQICALNVPGSKALLDAWEQGKNLPNHAENGAVAK
ncbi:hypothetical protein ACWQI2_006454, partial [Pseudomonas aeruginosa]